MEFPSIQARLVGGHCIGVDPIIWQKQEMGYHPEIILAGRRLNDSMGNMWPLVKLMIKKVFQ
jgi:UDP-N-acetyl-D-galactosamine dehydrogenase